MFKAKSEKNGGLTLLEHTQHVVTAMEGIAKHLGYDATLTRYAAILHDLGKGHPFFQKAIHDADHNIESLIKSNIIHRHEYSSLLFLSLFPVDLWDSLIEMVVSHHKSIIKDKSKRGLLDLIMAGEEEALFSWHADHKDGLWEDWSIQVQIEILPFFGISPKQISREEAEVSFNYTVEYCKNLPNGWSDLKGLMISADHFASHFGRRTEKHEDCFVKQQLEGLYKKPNLSFYNRISNLHPLSLQNAKNSKPHTLVIAPTGAGKTDYLLRRCSGRVFYVLPFQASINAMFERIDGNLNHQNGISTQPRKPKHQQFHIRHLHAASTFKKEVGGKELEDTFDEVALQKHPGASVKVLTPHQLAALAFGTVGHEAIAIDIKGCDVILDEVHVYTEFTQAMVIEITKALLRLNCNIHVGSATIPTALYDALLEILGGQAHVLEVKLPKEQIASFNRHTIIKHKDNSKEADLVKTSIRHLNKTLIVSNSVLQAQKRYKTYLGMEDLEDIPKLLVHSRFRRCDRGTLENLIYKFDKEGKPCIVCTTQVVEVSLDINYDCMFTDAAPLDSLIQRFGRVNRSRTLLNIGQLKPIHVFAPTKSTLPYKKPIVEASFEALPNGDLHETVIQSLIDSVYPEIDIREVGIHALFKDDKCQLKTLEHLPKSFFFNLLEIDSIPLIIESDVEYYEDWKNEDRYALEIPVPISVVHNHLNSLRQLKVGHRPFVVKDEWYNKGKGCNLTLPDFIQQNPKTWFKTCFGLEIPANIDTEGVFL